MLIIAYLFPWAKSIVIIIQEWKPVMDNKNTRFFLKGHEYCSNMLHQITIYHILFLSSTVTAEPNSGGLVFSESLVYTHSLWNI